MIRLLDAFATLRLVELCVCVSAALCSLELLARPKFLSDRGLLNWPVPKLRAAWLTDGVVAASLDRIFSYPGVVGLVAARFLAAALLMLAPAWSWPSAALCCASAALSWLMVLRTPFGNDGADQMTMLTFSALALFHACPRPMLAEAALWFIALQACLSYVTSGVAKAASPIWRSGNALVGIFRTQIYGGGRALSLLMRFRWTRRFVAWAVISTETVFPLVLVAPRSVAPWFFAGGLLFHISAAITMGLNTFLWAFVATYPAIAYCAAETSSVIYGR